jgi:hypothetical protein
MPFRFYFVLCLPLQFDAVHNEFQDQSVFRGGSVRRLDTQQHFLWSLCLAGSRMVTVGNRNRARQCFVGLSDDDPLLLVGRMCLAITITLAFPC